MALSDIDKSPLYIDSTNGRVGIGTSSPSEALTIEAPLSGDTGLAINYNGDNKAGITVNPTTGQIQVGAHPDLTSANAYYLSFNTASSNTVYERLRIDSSGVVGIGTNSPSGAKLEIFTGSTAVDGLKISRYTPGNYYSTLRQDNHGLAIHVGTGGTVSERVAITPNGITFNGDTAAANALDDYEEGTWTVGERNGQASLTTNRAHYTKIGNMVYAAASVTIGSNSNGNPLNFTLPFTSSINAYYLGGGNVSYHTLPGSVSNNLRPNIENAADNVFFFYDTITGLSCSEASGHRIDFFVIYHTSA